jgi:hypothetical protein
MGLVNIFPAAFSLSQGTYSLTMKLFSLIFGCSILSLFGFSQDSLYLKKISEAENFLVRSKLDSARLAFSEAFQYGTSPLGIDVHNALVANTVLNQHDNTLQLARRLFFKGVTPAYFRQMIYQPIVKNVSLFEKILVEYKNVTQSEEWLTSLNKRDSVRALLARLHEIDQQLYCQRPDSINNAAFISNLNRATEENADILQQLFKLDLLREEVMGMELTGDTTPNITPSYFVLVLHSLQKGDTLLSAALTKALNKAQIKPEVYAYLVDMYAGNLKYGSAFSVIRYKCRLFKQQGSSYLTRKQNQNRKSIHLGTIEDLQQKLIYSHTSNPHSFRFSAFLSAIENFENKEGEEGFLESHIEVPARVIGCD